MAEQVDDAAELQRPQQPKQHADLEAQHRDDHEVLIRVGIRMLAHRRGHHQRRDGHGADDELARRAEERIDHHRHQAGVEPGLRRQSGQKGVGDGLRDGDDAEHEAGDEVVREIRASVRLHHRHDAYVPGR